MDKIPKTCPDWKNNDWEKWKNEVEINSQRLLGQHLRSQLQIQQLWQSLLKIFQEATYGFIPNKMVSLHLKSFWTPTFITFPNEVIEVRDRYISKNLSQK